jgi:hypothetical protein
MSKRTVFGASIFPVSLGAIAAALVLFSATKAPAQLDSGTRSFAVVQNDSVVGEIWRDGDEPTHYLEHWVLYPGYVYPSTVNQIETKIQPGHHLYGSTADFLAHVPFERGARYVKVDCDDGESIPGR